MRSQAETLALFTHFRALTHTVASSRAFLDGFHTHAAGLDLGIGMMVPVHEQVTIVDDEAALHPDNQTGSKALGHHLQNLQVVESSRPRRSTPAFWLPLWTLSRSIQVRMASFNQKPG